ncbi:Chromosome segregation helicase [Streptococcus pyogenes]|nr:Chromosome segregation helicase [Streptococcus pyogenes]
MPPLTAKKRLQEIAEEAKFSGGLVLLLDEIHRLDKTNKIFFYLYLRMAPLS